MTRKDDSRVDLKDLNDEEAIFKAIRKQCLQSPLTILPLALAGGLLLLTGAFSWGFLGVFAAVVAGVVGAGAFVYNLWIRGEELAARHVRKLMERMKEQRRGSLSEVAKACVGIGLDEAAKEARELSEAYSRYTEFLETRAGAILGTAVGQRLELAESARSAGLAHLKRAAEIHIALEGIDITKLQAETAAWERELSQPGASESVLRSKLGAHAGQIARYAELSTRRDQLIARSNELEAALRSAHLADAGRADLSAELQLDDPAARLSGVIEAAEAAEAEMRDFLRQTTEAPLTN